MTIEFRIKNLELRIIKMFLMFSLFLILYSLFFIHPVFAQQATLSLSPSSGTFNQNCAFSLDINLNTGGADTDGTDAILLYDSSKFSATSIVNGTIYSEYPGNNIDDVNGKITISGLASISSPFNGQGKLATINFTVKSGAATGATQINFDFDPNNKAKTTDSNVVQRGTVTDILNSVVNGSYVVGSGACTSAAVPPVTGSGGTIPTSGGLPPTGGIGGPTGSTPSGTISGTKGTLNNTANTGLTYTVAIVGSVMVVLGVLGLAIL